MARRWARASHTWRYGKRVGEDEFGNVYYEGGTDSEGRTRRWVIYNGYAEASAIPPGWHGWMHHRVDVAAAERRLQAARLAEAASRRTSPARRQAYRPKGSVLTNEQRPRSPATTTPGRPGG